MNKFAFYFEDNKSYFGIVRDERLLFFKTIVNNLTKGTIVRANSFRKLKALDSYEVILPGGVKGILPFKDSLAITGQKILEITHEANLQKALRLSEKTQMVEKFKDEVNFTPSPAILYSDKYKLVKEKAKEFDIKIIKTNSLDLKNKLKNNFDIQFDKNYNPIYDYKISNLFSIKDKRKIDLDSGISIYLDRLEALSVVDINSGSFKLESKIKTAKYVNEFCVKHILNALVINEIKGIIIIDAIRTDNKSLFRLIDIFKREFELRKIIYDISYTKNKLIEILIRRN